MRPVSSFPRQYFASLFITGKTPTLALQQDQRFSYALYISDAHFLPPASPSTPSNPSPKLPLVITMHGTRREHLAARDSLIPLADSPDTACAVLAPLFPAGITGPEDLSSYKRLVAHSDDHNDAKNAPGSVSMSGNSPAEIRYDEILLAMIDEVSQRYGDGIETSTFHMVGYSGGGQFVHRFMYLHPDRIISASVGAPGDVTLMSGVDQPSTSTATVAEDGKESSEVLQWPQGTYRMEEIFRGFGGIKMNALRRIRLQIIVGEEDVMTEQFDLAGVGSRPDKRPRLEKARELCENWRRWGLDIRFDTVPGVAHSRAGCENLMIEFLGQRLREGREG